jgi:hypothetical protein
MYSLAPYCFIGTLMVLCPLQNPYSATGLAGVGKGRTICAERVKHNNNPISYLSIFRKQKELDFSVYKNLVMT